MGDESLNAHFHYIFLNRTDTSFRSDTSIKDSEAIASKIVIPY